MKKLLILLIVASMNVMMLVGCSSDYAGSSDELTKAEENVNGEDEQEEDEKELEEESVATPEPTQAPTPTPEKEELKLDAEAVGFDFKAFRDTINTPYISMYFALKNTGNVPFSLGRMYVDFEDNNGRLLGTDKYMVTIPDVILPGQTGYVYSYYYNMSGIDLNNGFKPVPHGDPVVETNVYAIKISDINVKSDYGNWVTVTARGTNDNGRDISFATPGAIFFDKDDKVIGFCYGLESFANGETKSFEISGELMSSDIKPSEIDHVEVWCVGSY